ncbi:MAG TPA: alpha/beta hydrolase [Candidatus Aquilonibacter sp.]
MQWVKNGPIQLCCEVRGRGSRHVLFAHGWISSRRMWYEVVERLDHERFTLHLLDFRGCGLSDRPRPDGDLEGYASDLRTVLASVDAPVTLVGHSLGGRLAQFVATEQPKNLERLILIAPGTAKAIRFTPARRKQAEETYGSRERIERFQRAAMFREVAPDVMERIINDALVASYEHWVGGEARGRIDFTDRLARITVPTLAIAGSNDPLAPPSRVKREVSGAITDALFVLLREAGHNLPVETPDDIAEAVRRFGD